MNRLIVSLPDRHAAGMDRDSRRRMWAGLAKRMGLIFLVMQVLGCTTQSPFTEAERATVMAGEKALVLIRIQCTIDNQPYEPFSFAIDFDNVNFGLGGFDSLGVPRPVRSRFLSAELRRDGWTYFLLAPGVYYLAVRPPQRGDLYTYDAMLKTVPRWRIDVPMHGKLVYAGTLHLTGKADPLLFGGRIMIAITGEEATVEKDRERAINLLLEHFPGAGDAKAIPMQRWQLDDPVIIRSPLPGSTR